MGTDEVVEMDVETNVPTVEELSMRLLHGLEERYPGRACCVGQDVTEGEEHGELMCYVSDEPGVNDVVVVAATADAVETQLSKWREEMRQAQTLLELRQQQ